MFYYIPHFYKHFCKERKNDTRFMLVSHIHSNASQLCTSATGATLDHSWDRGNGLKASYQARIKNERVLHQMSFFLSPPVVLTKSSKIEN